MIQYRTRKDLQQKNCSVVCPAITAKEPPQKTQGFAAKACAIVGCSSGDRYKRLTTEAARIPAQQKQLLVVRHAITAKGSRQKSQGFAAKAIVGCS